MTGTLETPATLYDGLCSIRVRPGDTVLLRGGTYTGDWLATIAGTAEQRITVMPYQHEPVTIDGVFGLGRYVDLIDADILWTGWETRTSAQAGGSPTDIPMPLQWQVDLATGARLINCTVRDGAGGIQASGGAGGAVVYGNIINCNGHLGPDRPHGHGAYFANGGVLCTLEQNYFGRNFGWSIHLYSASYSNISDFLLKRNVVRGSNVMGPDNAPGELHNISYVENVAYRAVLKMAYSSAADADDLTFDDNYWHGSVEFKVWRSAVATGSTFIHYGVSPFVIRIKEPASFTPYTWDENAYYVPAGVGLRYSDAETDTDYTALADWQLASGLDATSTLHALPADPPADRVFVWANDFAAVSKRKAMIAIYNWSGADTVNVDLSAAGLVNGTQYKLMQAQDPFGDVVPFTYTAGQPLAVDMRAVSHSVAVPYAHNVALDTTTFPEFGCFVIELAL